MTRDNWKPTVQDHHEAYFHEPYDHLNLRNACPGPDGKTFPFQKYYTTTPATHPIPQLGSYELLNLSQPCMSYYQRYNPYIDIPTSTNWSQYLNQCFKMHKQEQRSVIVMRAWQGYQWHRDDILNLRALIIELGLNTGGLFDIRILLEVKDGSAFLASDKEAQKVVDTVPEEFRSLVHLWSEHEMHGYYPGLNSVLDGNVIHGAYRGLFMALQKFAVEHSEYDYFYNWEMDIRYTGNYYEFFSKTNTWARNEPFDPTMRRSQKYYIPEIHNWISPPVPDDEEADLIQYGPIFDQIGSKWNFEKDVVGYENGTDTPRRAVIISASRLSRRLLLMMNHVNAELKSSVAPEAFPATVALHYGMKAIFIPHPVFIDKPWPPRTPHLLISLTFQVCWTNGSMRSICSAKKICSRESHGTTALITLPTFTTAGATTRKKKQSTKFVDGRYSYIPSRMSGT